jgi:ketosteroid isomerase-like protein
MSESCVAIRALLSAQAQLIRDRDVYGAIAHYDPEAVLFDVVDPLQSVGRTALTSRLALWLSSFEGRIDYELTQLVVSADGDVGFAHSLNHVHATRGDGQLVDMWWRATVCCRKQGAAWRITHAHNSVPFDPKDGRASLGLKP